jgi:hypothetical protein
MAYLNVHGLVGSFGEAKPSTLTAVQTNAGTLTLTMVNTTGPTGVLNAPGPITVNTSGTATLASLTVRLPDNVPPPNGYLQVLDCSGTITTLTVVSQASVAIVNAPTTLVRGTSVTMKYHGELTPPAWFRS